MVQTAVDDSIARLWKVIPVGYGKDFALVLKELDRRGRMLDTDKES